MYKSIRSFAFGGTVVFMSLLGVVMTAVAVNPETYKNLATGKCLDSNVDGKVYTLGCNGGSYQKWNVRIITPNREIKNLATGKCLDSNVDGKVYTLTCNNGSYQRWIVTSYSSTSSITLKNLATGKCLDSNAAGTVYTLGCNGGSYQKWQ